MAKIDCIRAVKAAVKSGTMNDAQAADLLQRMRDQAKLRAVRRRTSFEKALKDIAGEMLVEAKLLNALQRRNRVLDFKAGRTLERFSERFADVSTVGEGMRAFIEGSNRPIQGARRSVDYQAKALHHKFLGRLVVELEDKDLIRAFADNDNAQAIYIEMGELRPGGAPGKTKNKAAQQVAKIVEDISDEMLSRQNRAGSFTRKLPGYVVRQTHDQQAIRALDPRDVGKAFEKYYTFIIDRIDHEKTFKGQDPKTFLRKVFEGFYSGKHGPMHDEFQVDQVPIHGSLARKQSAPRVLHFKDAQAAYEYNQQFGIRDFKDQVFHDLFYRSRAIAMMENFGPNPEGVIDRITTRLAEKYRGVPGAAKQVDSLRDWRIKAAFNQVSGRNEIAANPTLSRISHNARSVVTMAKMGQVVLSSIGDKGFIQTEMAYQGISQLDTFAKQLTGMFPRSKEKKRALRLMGVALDGIIGNAIARFTHYNKMSGFLHRAQRQFFNLNFLNQWTDVHKASAAELMAAHLGEHAGDEFDALPADLSRVLSLYDIGPREWNIVRKHAIQEGDATYLTPESLQQADVTALIDGKVTDASVARARDHLETSLRTYIADRVDFAVPTPGAQQRKYVTLDTQAGTPLGEAIRMIMLFKSFPITVLSKIVDREVYGRGAKGIKDWILHDNKGRFYLLQMIAMTTAGGYLSGMMKDALKGRTPKPLIKDGDIVWNTVNDAALRGGGLGIFGDLLMSEYDNQSRNFWAVQMGPIAGDVSAVMALKGSEHPAADAGKLLRDNIPFINLFYIRPILDYLVLWNLQEMLSPGYLSRMERSVREKNHQDFFISPAEVAE